MVVEENDVLRREMTPCGDALRVATLAAIDMGRPSPCYIISIQFVPRGCFPSYASYEGRSSMHT